MRAVPLARAHAGWSRAGWYCCAAVTLLLWLSGWALHQIEPERLMELPAWQIGLRHAAQVLHGVLAWAFCLLAGRWVWPHLGLVWRRYTQRWAGWLGLVSLGRLLLLALSGLGLLYGLADWRDALIPWHWYVGLGWPLLLGMHVGARRWRQG